MKPLGTSRKIENIEISLAMEAFGKLCERRERMAIFKAEKSAFIAAWESRLQHPELSAEEALLCGITARRNARADISDLHYYLGVLNS